MVCVASVLGMFALGASGCDDKKDTDVVRACASYCDALIRCNDRDYETSDDCFRGECRDTPMIAVAKGEACAAALTRTLDCVSQLSCNELYDYEQMTSDAYPCRALEDREFEVCDW